MKKTLLLLTCFLCVPVLSMAVFKHPVKPVKVACIGNSITFGYTLPDPSTDSYPAQLQRMLGEGYEVGNFGKSGATLLNKGHRPYMRQVEFRKAMEFAGDIAVIHLGINDTDPRNWPNHRDDFFRDYLALIDSCRLANPKVRVLIARMTPIAHRHARFLSGTRDWHREIQEMIGQVSRYAGVQLIDFHEPLYPFPGLLPDAIHPNVEGAAKIAQVVYSAITGNYGGLRMPVTYTDNMVLQRDVELTLSGIANASDQVSVSVGGQNLQAKTGPDGKWSVRLQPLKAGGPYTLQVSTKYRKLSYKNVAVGEVWLCSGQSNMEFMLKQADTGARDIPLADNPNIRLFDMKARWLTRAVEWDASALDSVNALQYFHSPRWQVCTSVSASDFSAVAYYFARMLQDSLQVPVGLIANAVGGSPTESWIDRQTLEYDFPAILSNWTTNDFIQDWVRGRAVLNLKKATNAHQRHPYEPCYLYEAGILPLQRYPIKGVIWYQGESNAHNREAHKKLFELLVGSWRKNWNNEQLPFYYVQLSGLNRPSWTWFRDSQRRLMQAIPHTGMAVSTDYGDSLDVHPVCKQPIGERLARWALRQTYHHTDLTPSGPLFRVAEFSNGSVFLSFDYGKGMRSSDGEPLRTFEVAETEGLYYPAVAVVEGDRIRLSCKEVDRPRYVRYGWQPFTRANLVNSDLLPASTFRATVSY